MNIQKSIEHFRSKKWGIFHHFLGGHNGKVWNDRVNNVDVKLWANQLHELGCGFLGITVMQVTQCMLAPNKTYNDITGYKNGEACAERDLILELSDALSEYDIDLMLYYTGDGPCRDKSGRASNAFGFTTNQPICVNGKWTELIKEPEYIRNTLSTNGVRCLRNMPFATATEYLHGGLTDVLRRFIWIIHA